MGGRQTGRVRRAGRAARAAARAAARCRADEAGSRGACARRRRRRRRRWTTTCLTPRWTPPPLRPKSNEKTSPQLLLWRTGSRPSPRRRPRPPGPQVQRTGKEAMAADDAAVTEGTAPSPPRPTRSLESAEAAQGAGWGATTRTATTMSSSHLAAAVRTQPAPPRHHPPSTKQRVHRPPRPTPTPPTEVTEDGAVAAEREETDARSWRRMRGPQTPLTAWDAPVREWLRGEPSGKRARGTRGRPGDQRSEQVRTAVCGSEPAHVCTYVCAAV